MDRHAATRRLRRLAEAAGVRITRPHPHMLRHTWDCAANGSVAFSVVTVRGVS
jgi:integrase